MRKLSYTIIIFGILIVFGFIIGSALLIEGVNTFLNKPPRQQVRDFPLLIPPEDGKLGNFTIHTSVPPNVGFFVNKTITTNIDIEFFNSELTNDSSVQVVFSNALVLQNPDDSDKGGLIGKPITLTKKNENSNIFSGSAYLRYQHASQFDVKLRLINTTTDSINEKLQEDSNVYSYENVINILSPRLRDESILVNQNQGLLFIGIGLGLITSLFTLLKLYIPRR